MCWFTDYVIIKFIISVLHSKNSWGWSIITLRPAASDKAKTTKDRNTRKNSSCKFIHMPIDVCRISNIYYVVLNKKGYMAMVWIRHFLQNWCLTSQGMWILQVVWGLTYFCHTSSKMVNAVALKLPYRGKHWRVETLMNSLQNMFGEINFGEFEIPFKNFNTVLWLD